MESKCTVIVYLGDNSNKNYHLEAKVNIRVIDKLIYKDCMDEFSSDEYNIACEHIYNEISKQVNNLPLEWYLDKITDEYNNKL